MSLPEPVPPPFEVVHFEQLPGVPCPCGVARRAFTDTSDVPFTLHVTEISREAKRHYHQRLTETYFILECEPGAKMELNDEVIDVRPGTAVLIRPGTWHRAVGRMRVLIVVHPKFDATDEWLESTTGQPIAERKR